MKITSRKNQYLITLLAIAAVSLTLFELLVLFNLISYTLIAVSIIITFFVALVLIVYFLADEMNPKAITIFLAMGVICSTIIALTLWQLWRVGFTLPSGFH